MKFGLIGLLMLAAAPSALAAENPPAIPYDFDVNFLKMPQNMEAADVLSKQGIEAELIDLRTLRPLDTATVVDSVMKTNRIVTVEQGWPICSIGSEIAAAIVDQAFDYLDAPPLRVAGKDVPMPYAANLEKLALPNVGEVVAAVKAVCYK